MSLWMSQPCIVHRQREESRNLCPHLGSVKPHVGVTIARVMLWWKETPRGTMGNTGELDVNPRNRPYVGCRWKFTFQ